MPNYRRYYIPNAVVFVTAVTRDRIRRLEAQGDVDLFWHTSRRVQQLHPFDLLAYAILPDHFHWLMRVREPSGDFSAVLHSVKRNYTLNYKKAHGITASISLWQSRFWDHVIRSERDLANHLDYIHWNAVKHGFVERPEDWLHSTYRHWAERGYYEEGWGTEGVPASVRRMDLD